MAIRTNHSVLMYVFLTKDALFFLNNHKILQNLLIPCYPTTEDECVRRRESTYVMNKNHAVVVPSAPRAIRKKPGIYHDFFSNKNTTIVSSKNVLFLLS